jgi:Ca-activated chloride channel family protein
LLLSDGLANNGITDEKILQSIVKKNNHEKGITISTFGVGADFSENMMLGLAENGSGNYYFIKSPDEIPTIFKKELRGLLTVVAQNVKLEITIPENLKVNKVFGANYELSSNVLKVNFRDICSEETKAVLIRFDINNMKESQINFKSTLTFDDVVKTFSKKSLIAKSIVNNTSDNTMYTKSKNKEVTEQIILFESNEMLELAMKAVDEGNYEQAKSIVRSNKTNISNAIRAGYANKEIVMQDSVNKIYSEQLKNIESMKEYDKKMMQKDSKSSNYMLKKKRI